MRSAMSLIILAVRAGPETKPTSQQLYVTDVHNAVASNRQCLHFYFQHSRGSDPSVKAAMIKTNCTTDGKQARLTSPFIAEQLAGALVPKPNTLPLGTETNTTHVMKKD